MSTITFSRPAFAACAVLGAMISPAQGQYPGNGCGTCQPIQCYQTVPVTEYQPVRQTVRKPRYRTEYVEQPVTVYKPVTERRTTQVPTVRYQNVTTYRTVNRDMGRWVTQYRPNPRMAPCQYDKRPGVIGWFNRTGYQLRNAFTPKYTPIRQYQPRMMACTIPQTRQVAVRGTRTVAYNVTRMVPTQTVQRRAVQRLSYVNEEVTVMRPRTTYRTVPMGTSVAYAPSYGSSIAYAPLSGSSVAYAPYGGSTVAYGGFGNSIAYDSFGSSNIIRNAEVINDREVSSTAGLDPVPDAAFAADDPPMQPIRSADSAPKERRFERPLDTARRQTPATGTGATRFQRNPVARPRSTDRSIYDPKPGSSGGADPDPFGTGNSFELDGDPAGRPAASLNRPDRGYITTSHSKSPSYNGWRASRTIRSHDVPKLPTTRVSMARR